jgi:predicted nucleic acid-binding protein
MSFLLDTEILSEWMKPRPHPGVIAWLASADEDRVFLSVLALAELRQSVENRPDDRRRKRLNEWLQNDLPSRFEGRILTIDAAVADAAGRMMARRIRGLNERDTLVAATAAVHGLTVVTNRPGSFKAAGAATINPWAQR